MSLEPEPNHIPSILRKSSAKTACFFKIFLLSALFFPILLASQPAKAESPPILSLNTGLSDAWYNTVTNGQGFLIMVYPESKQVFLAWFTFDTERPPENTTAIPGESGHRWLTAQGPYDGDTANLTIFKTEGGRFDAAEPAASTDPTGVGTMTLEFADCTEGLVTYEFTSSGISGEIPIQRIVPEKITLCEALAASEQPACTRPDPDISHGLDNPPRTQGAIVDRFKLIGGGPGPDGIPPLELPKFIQNISLTNLDPAELVVGVKVGDDIRAYPHKILNWHEVVNDQFTVNGAAERATLSYCPLTGSAMLWKSFRDSDDKTFGTSGIIYNSNLIMYDRETESWWAQMLEQSILGRQVTRIPDRLQVVETIWGTWQAMYPETTLLSIETGFSRDYNAYPYGTFREDNNLIFEVDNMLDTRLHRKERVLGINVGAISKVYPIRNFSNDVEVINETVGHMQVVTVGSSGLNFGVVFNRELEDCTVLEFEAIQGRLPVVMRDNEGNEWDIFGTAVSGERTGQQLQKTNSYVAYWYAWTAFFQGAQIHQ